MAKAAKKKDPEKHADKYEEKVTSDGTFEGMTDISVKDAEKKAADKKAGDEDTKKVEDRIDGMNATKDRESAGKKLDQKMRDQ